VSTARIEETTISPSSETIFYDGAVDTVKSYLRPYGVIVVPTTLADAISKSVANTMTINFRFTGTITQQHIDDLNQQLAHAGGMFTLDSEPTESVRLCLTLNMAVGAENAERLSRERRLAGLRQLQNRPSKLTVFFLTVAAATLVLVWMLTSWDSKMWLLQSIVYNNTAASDPVRVAPAAPLPPITINHGQ
jgi:hypothetical protein